MIETRHAIMRTFIPVDDNCNIRYVESVFATPNLSEGAGCSVITLQLIPGSIDDTIVWRWDDEEPWREVGINRCVDFNLAVWDCSGRIQWNFDSEDAIDCCSSCFTYRATTELPSQTVDYTDCDGNLQEQKVRVETPLDFCARPGTVIPSIGVTIEQLSDVCTL